MNGSGTNHTPIAPPGFKSGHSSILTHHHYRLNTRGGEAPLLPKNTLDFNIQQKEMTADAVDH